MTSTQRWTLAAAVVGSGMVFLDSTVVTVALPTIGRELPTPRLGALEAQSYVYTGYLLTLSAFLILAGALADEHGRRRLFAIGLAAFGATSLLCGLAPTMETLIAARLLQGAAGAILVPGSLAIITACFEGEERGRAFGVWAAASAATTIVGPVVGGALVDTISWRVVFLLNLPLAAAGLWATFRRVEESRETTGGGRFDWLGATLVTVAVGGLTVGPIRGQERAWEDPLAFVLIACGVAAAIAFPFVERAAANPLLPLELFRSRNFSVTNASTLLIYGALYVSFYFIVVFLQGTVGYSAAAAGAAGVPATLLLVVGSSRVGRLAGRHGTRWFMTSGPLVMAGGLLWLARLPPTTGAWQLDPGVPASFVPPNGYLVDVLPGMLAFGVGLTLLVAPLTTALMGSVPVRNSGVASAVNNAISRVGPQLVTAVLFVVATAVFTASLRAQVGEVAAAPETRLLVSPLNAPHPDAPAELAAAARRASTDAFHLAMFTAAALLAAGGLVNAAGIRDHAAAPAEPAGAAQVAPSA